MKRRPADLQLVFKAVVAPKTMSRRKGVDVYVTILAQGTDKEVLTAVGESLKLAWPEAEKFWIEKADLKSKGTQWTP